MTVFQLRQTALRSYKENKEGALRSHKENKAGLLSEPHGRSCMAVSASDGADIVPSGQAAELVRCRRKKLGLLLKFQFS